MARKKNTQIRKQLIILATMYLAGGVFFMSVSPDSLPLWALIIPFMYIFAVVHLTMRVACDLLRVKSSGIISLIISVFGVLLFVLGSLHQLTLRDVIISCALTGALTWYILRASKA